MLSNTVAMTARVEKHEGDEDGQECHNQNCTPMAKTTVGSVQPRLKM